MFSIIIPLYNKAPYIAKAIQSVAAQTLQEFELIVIDDGSTDESLEKLRVTSYELQARDPDFFAKLRIIEQKNCGVSTTRNKGVGLAKYDYIAFLDADDWWEPTFLEEMQALITEFPEAGIYGSSYYKVRNGKFIPADIGVEKGFEKGYINYFQTYARTMWMPIWTGAVIIPKAVYQEMNGFKPELKLGEDFHLWVRIALKQKVAFISKQLANYNQDVDEINRAVGNHKQWTKDEHFIYNLGFLEIEEEKNENLKIVLDKFRVHLIPYLLNNELSKITKLQLNKVNWKKQEKKYELLFHTPSLLLRLYLNLISILISVKNNKYVKRVFGSN